MENFNIFLCVVFNIFFFLMIFNCCKNEKTTLKTITNKEQRKDFIKLTFITNIALFLFMIIINIYSFNNKIFSNLITLLSSKKLENTTNKNVTYIFLICLFFTILFYILMYLYSKKYRTKYYDEDKIILEKAYKTYCLKNTKKTLNKKTMINFFKLMISLKDDKTDISSNLLGNWVEFILCDEYAAQHADSSVLEILENEAYKKTLIKDIFYYTQKNINTPNIFVNGRHFLYLCGSKNALLQYIDTFKDFSSEEISENELNKINALQDDFDDYNNTITLNK